MLILPMTKPAANVNAYNKASDIQMDRIKLLIILPDY